MYPTKSSPVPKVHLVLILILQLILTKISWANESNQTNSWEERIAVETFEKLQSADNSTIEKLQETDNSTLPLITKFSVGTVHDETPRCPPGTDLNADNKCQKVYQFNNPQQDNSNETKSEAIDENNSSSEGDDEFSDCHAFHSANPKLIFFLVTIYTLTTLRQCKYLGS